MLGRRQWIAISLVIVALAACACGSSRSSGGSDTAASSTATDKPPKVAVVLYGPANDGGWNTTWTAAVDKLKAAVPGAQVTVVPNVNPGAQAQKTLSTLGQQGYGLVVVTGGYTTADFKKATATYPNTQYVNLFGTDVGPNLSRFDIGLEDSRYLDGMLAAMATKSNIIGEVGGYPIPVEIRTLDALALGAQSINKDVKVKILWVNSFYDPAKERQAAQALVDAGADVLVMDSNTPAVASVAKANDVKFIGYGISRNADAPGQWLGAFSFNWAPYLIDWTKKVQAGTFKPGLFYWGLPNGVVGRTEYGSSVSQSDIDQIDQTLQQIKTGELVVFQGPITDNTGKVVVPEGEAIDTPAELAACCTWYNENVEGNSSSS